MNFSMWKKALTVIPDVTKDEWDKLDIISKWLISTRAAVLVMTLLSAIIPGLLALHDGYSVNPWVWLILCLGLVFSHGANNIFNDFTDYVRGVDKDNYFRTQYGPQPIADGLMTKRQHLLYFVITGGLALLCGLVLAFINHNDLLIWGLIAAGAVFVLFYTWPMKGIALGELAVFLVWGPLMIGGGYYVLTEHWSWMVVLGSIPYVLGVVTVIFGKHIDKREMDKEKKIYTLPVVIGEKASRIVVIAMMLIPYLVVFYLIVARYFTPVMLVVLVAVPQLVKLIPQFLKPKPLTRPDGFPDGQGGWPLYFAPQGFVNTRTFGLWFMFGLILDLFIRLLWPEFWIV